MTDQRIPDGLAALLRSPCHAITSKVLEQAADRIEQQAAEIDLLEGETGSLALYIDTLRAEVASLTAQNAELERERKRLRGLVVRIYDALQAEARAKMAADNALANFTNPQPEVDKSIEAAIHASNVMSEARKIAEGRSC